MELARIISQETGTSPEEIFLLRHGNGIINTLLRYGATVEELTEIQPIGTRYDFSDPNYNSKIVVVIVYDKVYGVYRIHGVRGVGTNYTLSSESYQRFDKERNVKETPCRKYNLEKLPSIANDLLVYGWDGRTRTPVQRYDDSFFWEIKVKPIIEKSPLEEMEAVFQRQVSESMAQPAEIRQQRLALSLRIPTKVIVNSWVFVRNPDVVAEALYRSKGFCDFCQQSAPFKRRSDGSPYLEVHHKIPLSLGGEDTIENAVALCPNCHRQSHYA